MTNTAIEWISRYGEGAIFVLTFLESSAFTGLIVPGEMAAVLGGVFASQGILNLHLTVIF
jgi:membrane protein DedA with SNARE-associated domain